MYNRFGTTFQKDGLIEDLHSIQHTRKASKADRFVNQVVDYLISTTLGLMYMGVMIFMISSFTDDKKFVESDLLVFMGMGFYCIGKMAYYTGFEYGNKGRTVGKMITATIAVRDTGAPLTLKDTLLRSLFRFIPLEEFSGLGTQPWHDELSRTMVIKG